MPRPEEIQAIRQLRPFAKMSEQSFQTLMRVAYLQRFPKEVVLLEEGDPADMLYIVVDGAVEMYSAAAGGRTTIAIFRPITAFILAAVVTDLPNLMSARTLQASRVLMIPATTIQELIQTDSGFATAMIDELARGFRTMVKTNKNLKLRNGPQRIANYLLRLRAEDDDADRVELATEKSVLASLLGMTRENFSRSLTNLRDHGVVIRGREVIFQDVRKLEAFARPDPLIDDPAS